jgi:hypothetical protein
MSDSVQPAVLERPRGLTERSQLTFEVIAGESHTNINPSGIVPAGPVLDLSISADELSKIAA